MMSEIAQLQATWEWKIFEDNDAGSCGGYRARVLANRNAEHDSNFVEEIDLTWVDPAQVRAFGEALVQVAAKLEWEQNPENRDD